MANPLARVRPLEEVALEKVRLIKAALRILKRGQETISEDLDGIIAHVIQIRGLDQTSSKDMNQAFAVVVVSMNFALDCVAEMRMTKHPEESKEQAAAHILRTKPKPEIFAFAERRFTEISQAAEKLLGKSTITRQGTGQRFVYDLLDQETYNLLVKWSKGELSDFPGLPLATKAEANAVETRLQEIEAELTIARKANWQKILDPIDAMTGFSAGIFRREKTDQPSSSGSVWHALVLSLMAKALGDGWQTPFLSATTRAAGGIELFVYSDAPTAAKIIAEILLEPEKVNDRAIQAAARVASMAFRPGNQVFTKPCEESEVHAILNLGGQLLVTLAQEAFQHYNAEDVERPTNTEVDEFTRTRLFVYIPGDQKKRTARAQAQLETPWVAAKEARNLKDLAQHLAGFAAWPPVERTSFSDGFDLGQLFPSAVLINPTESSELVGEILAGLTEAEDWQTVITNLVSRMNRMGRTRLIGLLIESSAICNQHEAALRTIVALGDWNVELVCEMIWKPGFGYAGDVAVRAIADNLRPQDWKKIVEAARNRSHQSLRRVWEGMSLETRIQNLTHLFHGDEAARIFQSGTVAEMRTVLEPVMQEAGRSREAWGRFKDWQKNPSHRLAFEEREWVRDGFVDTFVNLLLQHQPR